MTDEIQDSASSRPLLFTFLPYDLLKTKGGRLTAFFMLYVTEGIPLGFTGTAVATQMRRADISPESIGWFVGMLYLPWSFKWVMGPIVDNVHIKALGRRRSWILTMQLLMLVGLLASTRIDFSTELMFFTGVIFIVNIFGATQDVAIDALAVGALKPEERGVGNGLMFAGSYFGLGLGGSGVLFLSSFPEIGFTNSGLLVIGLIAMVTVFVVLPMREKTATSEVNDKKNNGDTDGIVDGLKKYTIDAYRAFTSSRGAKVAVVYAILPCGALGLSLALGTVLAVEFGMKDDLIGQVTLISTVISGVCCVIGGFLSDRFGRRKMISIYVMGMSVATLIMAYYMYVENYHMPVKIEKGSVRAEHAVLVDVYIWTSYLYACFMGLMYGTRTAMFMDVCDPKVAATQFTAYMSLLNFVIFYMAALQGYLISEYGYPITLTVDAILGVISIGLLPWFKPLTVHAEIDDIPVEPGLSKI